MGRSEHDVLACTNVYKCHNVVDLLVLLILTQLSMAPRLLTCRACELCARLASQSFKIYKSQNVVDLYSPPNPKPIVGNAPARLLVHITVLHNRA